MKIATIAFAAALALSSGAAFAQANTGGVSGSSKPVGPASENGNTSTGQTAVPSSISGRSASPQTGTTDANPPATNPNMPHSGSMSK